MKVTIITICYNSEYTLEKTILSVLEQDYKNLEYIVVDGASSDGTKKILNKYQEHIDTLISGLDKGVYDAMNKGLEAASGELIGILNSDDFYIYPTVISEMVDKLDKTGSEAVYADLYYVDRIDIAKVKRYWKAGEYKISNFLRGWMPPHPTFFLKKKCYQEFGPYDLRFKTSADYELMLRMLYKHKVKVAYLPKTIVKMRLGGQSNASVKNRLKANKEDKLAWQINGLRPGPLTFVLKPLLKVSQFYKR